MNVLIVDDEPVARKTVRLLLEKDPVISIAGECANGAEALNFLANHPVDLMFLDIQMPAMTGFDLLAKVNLQKVPMIIFVTAYDEYALRAFDVHAFDYLLKPFDDDRFYKTLERAKEHHAAYNVTETSRRLISLLEDMRSGQLPRKSGGPEYPKRFMIKSTGKVEMVDVDDIEWIEADGDYARLIINDKPKLLREKISDLEQRLDPAVFVRTHRSYILRINRIKELKPLINGDYKITLHNGRQLPLSRTYREQVLSLLQKSN